MKKSQSETLKDPSIVRRYKAFGYALAGLLLVLMGAVSTKGTLLAAVDFASAGLGILGVWFYVTESRKQENQALDLLSSLGETFEKIVVFGSPAVAGMAIGVHLANGAYDE